MMADTLAGRVREVLAEMRSCVRRCRREGKAIPFYFDSVGNGDQFAMCFHDGRAYAERTDTYGRIVRRYWLEPKS